MAHIHTEPGQHDFTASAFIVRTDFDEPKLMLHMHKKLGKWLQFGGHVESHENPWEALEHEVLEESGYSLDQLTLLEPFKGPELTGCVNHPIPLSINTHVFSDTHKHIDIEYGFVTDQTPHNPVDDGESSQMGYFTLSELKELPDDKIPSNVRDMGIFMLTKLV